MDNFCQTKWGKLHLRQRVECGNRKVGSRLRIVHIRGRKQVVEMPHFASKVDVKRAPHGTLWTVQNVAKENERCHPKKRNVPPTNFGAPLTLAKAKGATDILLVQRCHPRKANVEVLPTNFGVQASKHYFGG